MNVIISASNQASGRNRKNIDQLIKEREKTVKGLIKPLADKPNELYVEREPTSNSYTIAIRDGIKYPGGYRNQRFNTIAPKIAAGYFEIWKKSISKSDNSECYYLDRAYLHFYIIDKKMNSEQEFFLLHCDPNEPEGEHVMYKKSLHLHIKCNDAPYPHCDVWPHCHLALNIGMLDQVLASVDSLTEAIKMAILMVRKQVLEALI